MSAEEFTLTNLELRESTETGEVASGLSHASMKGMFLLQVQELASDGEPRGCATVVHDAGDHGGRYRDLARVLAADGWAVALPSMRGHGGTEGERGHSAGRKEVVRDLTEIQDHLAYRMPDAPKVLVGQGLGALHALAYALEVPGMAAALVLISPLHEPTFVEPEAPRGLKKFLKKLTPQSPGSIGWKPDQLTGDSNQAAAYLADTEVHDIITLRAIQEAQASAAEYLPRLAQVGVPVLILHGEDDPIASVERSKALEGEGIAVKTFPGQRHDLLHDTGATEVQAALRAWLDENLPRG